MAAMQSNSSKFIERWSRAEHLNARLLTIFVSLVVVCVVLSFALISVSTRPRAIYVIPGVWQAGVVMPVSNPASVVSSFVTAWALNWNNFSPENAKDVYKRAQRFMAPQLLAKTKARLEKDIQEIEKNNMSSLFTIIEDPIVETQKKGFKVTLKGEKGIYLGKEEIKSQKLVFTIGIHSVSSTENNPYGFMIDTIEQEINS